MNEMSGAAFSRIFHSKSRLERRIGKKLDRLIGSQEQPKRNFSPFFAQRTVPLVRRGENFSQTCWFFSRKFYYLTLRMAEHSFIFTFVCRFCPNFSIRFQREANYLRWSISLHLICPACTIFTECIPFDCPHVLTDPAAFLEALDLSSYSEHLLQKQSQS